MTMIDFMEGWIDELSGHDKIRVEAAQQKAKVSLAGEALQRLRAEAKDRPPRIFTGRIGNRRGWRKMLLVLPNGSIGNLIVALRGFAAVAWHDPFSVQPNRIDYFRVSELRRYRTPAAVVLGSRKRGTVEKRSERKARAARSNGQCPPRPGSRPRGRPRKTAPPPPPTHQSAPIVKRHRLPT